MKVLAIMGSHRKGKNTELALDTFLSGLPKEAEVDKVYLLGKDIKVCAACSYCEKHYGTCIHDDEMTVLYEKFKTADAVVFASPVYFNSVTTLMKIMIDRVQMILPVTLLLKNHLLIKRENRKKVI